MDHPHASTNPHVTTVVTTYNGEKFIEAQLKSIRDQTCPPDDVWIFDDRSRDATPEVVRKFIAESSLDHWHFVVNDKNYGPSKNNLSRLPDLQGDLVFFADQDDVWAPTKIEIMSKYMTRHPDVSLLVSRTTLIGPDGQPPSMDSKTRAVLRRSRIHRGPSGHPQDLGLDDFLGHSSVPLHAMCLRGDVVRRIGAEGSFPELSRSLGADWYLGMFSSVMGSSRLIPDVLVLRRVHDSNVSMAGLRKSTLLAASHERRIEMLREAADAHRTLMASPLLQRHLSLHAASKLERMTDLLESRTQFTERPTFAQAIRLFTQMPSYITAFGTFGRGLRAWAVDVMYAYELNWRISRRDRP